MSSRIQMVSFPSLNSFSFSKLLNNFRPSFQAHRVHLHPQLCKNKRHSNKSCNNNHSKSSSRRPMACKIRCRNFILVRNKCSSWTTSLAEGCQRRWSPITTSLIIINKHRWIRWMLLLNNSSHNSKWFNFNSHKQLWIPLTLSNNCSHCHKKTTPKTCPPLMIIRKRVRLQLTNWKKISSQPTTMMMRSWRIITEKWPKLILKGMRSVSLRKRTRLWPRMHSSRPRSAPPWRKYNIILKLPRVSRNVLRTWNNKYKVTQTNSKK